MTQIRVARKEDAAELLSLATQFPSPTGLDESAFYKIWEEKFNDSSSYIGIAESGNKITGYISGHLHLAFYANGATFWVDEIFVIKEERKSGTGRSLMESVIPWIGDRECKLIALATNGAKEFYRELGFQDSAKYFKKYL